LPLRRMRRQSVLQRTAMGLHCAAAQPVPAKHAQRGTAVHHRRGVLFVREVPYSRRRDEVRGACLDAGRWRVHEWARGLEKLRESLERGLIAIRIAEYGLTGI